MTDIEHVMVPGEIGLIVDIDSNIRLLLPQGEEDGPIDELLAAMVAACIRCEEDPLFRAECLQYWRDERVIN